MNRADVCRRLDSCNQPHVVQQFHVPFPGYSTFSNMYNELAVYSMWNHFVSYLEMQTASASQYRGQDATTTSITSAQELGKSHSKHPCESKKDSEINPFTGLPRLRVFVDLANGAGFTSRTESPSPVPPCILSSEELYSHSNIQDELSFKEQIWVPSPSLHCFSSSPVTYPATFTNYHSPAPPHWSVSASPSASATTFSAKKCRAQRDAQRKSPSSCSSSSSLCSPCSIWESLSADGDDVLSPSTVSELEDAALATFAPCVGATMTMTMPPHINLEETLGAIFP